jgi:transcriptional regulator with XRE-family HTH domain
MERRRNEDAMRMRVAENLWWLRAQRRMSQEHLADRSEIHRTQISLLESGRREPLAGTIVALASGLRVPVQELFAGIRFAPPKTGARGEYVVDPFEFPIDRKARR